LEAVGIELVVVGAGVAVSDIYTCFRMGINVGVRVGVLVGFAVGVSIAVVVGGIFVIASCVCVCVAGWFMAIMPNTKKAIMPVILNLARVCHCVFLHMRYRPRGKTKIRARIVRLVVVEDVFLFSFMSKEN
jgi:hypothetical protein